MTQTQSTNCSRWPSLPLSVLSCHLSGPMTRPSGSPRSRHSLPTVEKTKFEYVIASLQPEFATEVILNPPEENPFTTLKTALVDRTATSEQRRLQQLLTEEELRDRKPSQLLRHVSAFRRQRHWDRQVVHTTFSTAPSCSSSDGFGLYSCYSYS